MGLSLCELLYITHYEKQGLFNGFSSVIELGCQEFMLPVVTLMKTLKLYYPGKSIIDVDFDDLIDGSDDNNRSLEAYYKFIGFDKYDSIDLHPRYHAIGHDLNYHYNVTEQYDLVTNLGTLEHVFDIKTGFETMHNLCKDGGIMIHIMPMMGYYGQIFWGVQKEVYTGIAKANGYEVISLMIQYDLQKPVVFGFTNAQLPAMNLKDSNLIVIFKKTNSEVFKIPIHEQYEDKYV